MRTTLLAAFAAVVVFVAAPARAGDAEIDAAQSTIDSQLRAFLADDDTAAYSYAAPGIKRMFPTVDSFMSMVKQAYRPVHRPQHYSFGRSRSTGPGSVVQEVLIVGPTGKNWIAVYTLERQPDGTFRITGVSLRGSDALST